MTEENNEPIRKCHRRRSTEYWNRIWSGKNIKNIKLKKALIKNANRKYYNDQRTDLSNHIAHAKQMHAQNKLKRNSTKSKKLNNVIIVQP